MLILAFLKIISEDIYDSFSEVRPFAIWLFAAIIFYLLTGLVVLLELLLLDPFLWLAEHHKEDGLLAQCLKVIRWK